MELFKDNEEGYLSWCEKHRVGYVYNNFGGSDASYNKLHLVSCSFLWREKDEGARTTVEKICSSELNRLEKVATELRGSADDWEYCKVCMKEKYR